MEVKFYESVEDCLLEFAVILSKFHGKWVFCKHRERNTYEVPGGHRENNESILETAKRELYEETGAIEFEIDAGIYEKVKSLKRELGMWQLSPKARLSFLCSICYKRSRE